MYRTFIHGLHAQVSYWAATSTTALSPIKSAISGLCVLVSMHVCVGQLMTDF